MTEPSTGWAMAFKSMLLKRAGRDNAQYAIWIAAGFIVILVAGRAVSGSIDDALGDSIISYGQIGPLQVTTAQ